MHTVRKIHIKVPGLAKHYFRTYRLTLIAVAGSIRLVVSLGFNNLNANSIALKFTV